MPFFLRFNSLFCILIIVFFSCLSSASESQDGSSDYTLHVSFIPEKQLLIGTARISIPKQSKLQLSLFNLDITGTLLQDQSGREHELTSTRDILILPATDDTRTLYISYTRKVDNEKYNRISTNGIALTRNWYPTPVDPMLFTVSAELPVGFEAIVESDIFPLRRTGNIVSARFSKATTSLHLISGPYEIRKLMVRDGLYVYSMFFKEDKDLTDGFLNAAAQYLKRYEEELGEYPFNHFVIVANRQPTGFGIPTFTLLGQKVLRLPFIISTSLAHEIVHSWFGNGIEVDPSLGNWCEGLTSYLSDHRSREDKSEGIANRKESIVKYLSYVQNDNTIPLSEFKSATKEQPMADTRRAVGYNRGALFFHELKEKIGADNFRSSLQNFVSTFKWKKASWDDLKQCFEVTSGRNLSRFFDERLLSREIPSVRVENITVGHVDNKPCLNFSLIQNSNTTFSLDLPLRIKTMSATHDLVRKIDGKRSTISIPLEQRPLEFTIDPEYSFLRELSNYEMPAVWSRFLGAKNKLIVLENERAKEAYQPILRLFTDKDTIVTGADAVQDNQIAENNILFLGVHQRPLHELLGRIEHNKDGVTLEVRANPLSSGDVVVLLSGSSRDELTKVAGRLKHYGKYSYLYFLNGKKLSSSIQETLSGLHHIIEELPAGGLVQDTSDFHTLVRRISGNRVIYIGENHTSYSDHLLQLRVIEALHEQGHPIAIGMEMFPTSAQPALDRYIMTEEIKDEASFLKESDYFNVWRYDYLFFRDIIDFAKKNRIPVIGLNLDQAIVSRVFREGGTDKLEEDILHALPSERDLGIAGYAESLKEIHNIHVLEKHATGSVSGFIQSQSLWDESMAENIVRFLKSHPDRKMIVLAGSQHSRKDFGIPPRVQRRLNVPQASILNIFNGSKPSNLQQIADYFFLSDPITLPHSPKLGIVLVPTESKGNRALQITQLSPHGQAGKAGLMKGDTLVEVGGRKIYEMADLRIAMLDATAGEYMEVKVMRYEEEGTRLLSFDIELTLPPKPASHP